MAPVQTSCTSVSIADHMPMAARLARSFAGRGEDLDDLTQVAMLGLVKAAKRFDPERGVSFAQYAYPCILGELKKHFRDSAWSLHLTRRMQELHLQVNKATAALTQQLGRTPAPADIATHLGLTEEEVHEGLNCAAAYQTRSLESPVSSDGTTAELGQLIGKHDEHLESVPDRYALRKHIKELPEREQKILHLRFFGDLTQGQIAEKLGISQMHVSRLLSQSITILRGRMLAEV
ncbi:SigB/SigF/SigG family RNA polymerase sigma factor [Catelliglobosispora koreensis]|uniref:SigB/SigF/SigG family RNA polymerase sigma factor n=1 Tax=Catelliglobosispora koreensis TaxID=129052 RepID=UPI00058B336D|nr:SigB/SigF/SigG family RNA polymerase sigma factor [Catelliglobosispora koreensis]